MAHGPSSRLFSVKLKTQRCFGWLIYGAWPFEPDTRKRWRLTVEDDSGGGGEHDDPDDGEAERGPPADRLPEQASDHQHTGDDDEACAEKCHGEDSWWSPVMEKRGHNDLHSFGGTQNVVLDKLWHKCAPDTPIVNGVT